VPPPRPFLGATRDIGVKAVVLVPGPMALVLLCRRARRKSQPRGAMAAFPGHRRRPLFARFSSSGLLALRRPSMSQHSRTLERQQPYPNSCRFCVEPALSIWGRPAPIAPSMKL
jgi:hypothetical protein